MKRPKPVQLVLVHSDASSRPSPLSRAAGRKNERREAPTPKPWLCVVLGIDTAARSGWCIRDSGSYLESGEVDTLDEHALSVVCAQAIERAAIRQRPVVLVLESPWGGNVHVVAGLGQARERWRRAWLCCDQAPGRIVKVTPSVWRGPVLGSYWVKQPRDEVRRQEQLIAHAMIGHACGPDESPAVLISHWASHAAIVGRAIGKRAQRASLQSWTTRNGDKP